jgi:hypothetical protein
MSGLVIGSSAWLMRGLGLDVTTAGLVMGLLLGVERNASYVRGSVRKND